MELIKAAELKQTMQEVVYPYIESHKETGFFERIPGKKLYYEHIRAEEEKAEVVLLHGFTEWIPKYYETVWYFTRLGISVWLMEQEGHGFSFREVEDASLVYIGDHRDLVEDAHYFVTEIVRKGQKAERPQFLFGHSMGGGVSALLLEKYPEDFDYAILNSPMMQIDNGGIPVWVAKALTAVLKVLGKGKAGLPGSGAFDPNQKFEGLFTYCKERFEYDLERQIPEERYHTCSPAVNTAAEFLKITQNAVAEENVRKITAEVLLFQAEEDGVVLPGGQDLFIQRLGDKGTKVIMPKARHELYREKDEVLPVYWQEIEKFVEKVLA